MTNIIGIYKITSPSGRMYIGQSWNMRKRWNEHKSKKPGCKKLGASINKYGAKQHLFEVIHYLPKDIDQSVMDVYECLYISQYLSAGIELLNIKEGGRGGKHSTESRRKIAKSRKGKYAGENHPLYGKPCSDEAKEKMRQTAKKRKRNPEEVERLQTMNLGRKRSEAFKEKMRKIALNRSPEAKNNIRNIKRS